MSNRAAVHAWLRRQHRLFNSTWEKEKAGRLITQVPAHECRRRLVAATSGMGQLKGSANQEVRLIWRRDGLSNALQTVIYCSIAQRPHDTAIRYEIRTDRLGATIYAVGLTWVAIFTAVAPLVAWMQNDPQLALGFLGSGVVILSAAAFMIVSMRDLSESDGDPLLGHVRQMLDADLE